MEPIAEKLKLLIEGHLRDGEADLEVFDNGHVAGHIISSEFDGLSYADRRKKIWAILDQHMTDEEKKQVSTLLTYTPEEWHIPLSTD